MRQTNLLLIAANGKPGATRPKFVPVPRPVSAYSKVAGKLRTDERLRRHDALVAKLLGDRARKE